MPINLGTGLAVAGVWLGAAMLCYRTRTDRVWVAFWAFCATFVIITGHC